MLHCVDHNHLKQRPLYEVFPPIQTFNQVKDVNDELGISFPLGITLHSDEAHSSGYKAGLNGDVRAASQQSAEHPCPPGVTFPSVS